MNVVTIDHNHNPTTDHSSEVSSLLLHPSPPRTREALLFLPSMSEQPESSQSHQPNRKQPQPQQKPSLSSKGTTATTKQITTVDSNATATTGSNKLQQLKASLREQRRRHATILCGGGMTNQNQVRHHQNTDTTTTGSQSRPPIGNRASSSSTVSIDGTTHSSSQCSSSSISSSSKVSHGDTVTTAQSTMMDSRASSNSSRNSIQQQQQQQTHSSTCSNRIVQPLNVGISPLSCNTGLPNTPKSNPANLHLHKSIHVPNLNVVPSPTDCSSSEYSIASPANSSFDNDDDDDVDDRASATSSVKPPTLAEIYAAMGESLDSTTTSPVRSVPMHQINVPSSPKGMSCVSVPTASQPPTTATDMNKSPKNTTVTITLPSTPPPNKRQHGFNTTTPNSSLPGNRSSYISNLYDSPVRVSPPLSRRPTIGLRRFEQRTTPSAESQPVEKNNHVDSKSAHNLDETSLSEDVLDAISSTPTAVLSVQTSSSATLSLSESLLDSDTDDDGDDACDYTTNSDTSGWASMGDSTAGPLGGSDSITTDHVSVGSLGSSYLYNTRHPVSKPVSPILKQRVEDDPKIATTTTSIARPPTLPIRKNSHGKPKNTVTFQIESIEVNIAKSQTQQKRDKPAQIKPVSQKASTNSPIVNRPLFVTARRADELCQAHGGHFSIAIRCGMKLLLPSKTNCIPLVPLPIQPKTSSSSLSLNVRLSTDFRCGTYGSLYDIAMRSGGTDNDIVLPRRRVSGPTPKSTDKSKVPVCERKTRTRVIRTTTTTTRLNPQLSRLPNIVAPEPIPTKHKKNTIPATGKGKSTTKKHPATTTTTNTSSYLPVRGGIYDTALKSGWIKEDSVGARASYSITMTTPSELRPSRHNDILIVPERISDQQCGVRSLCHR